MPLHLERIDWMPSPPLAPDDGAIDIAHLQRMTFGDAALQREVLAMFAAQSVGLLGAMAALTPDTAALAHKLKGSATGIGAFRVADAAENLEDAIRSGGAARQALVALNDAMADARAAVDAILRRS